MNFLDLPEGESVFIDANVFLYAFAERDDDHSE
jgi:hypothetical protein